MAHQIRKLTKFITLMCALFIHPIAWVPWGIERIIRRWYPDWQFTPILATPYFLGLIFISVIGLTSGNILFSIVAIYILSAMQLLSFWICLMLASTRLTGTSILFLKFAKRQKYVEEEQTGFSQAPALHSKSIFMAIASYCLTIFFFGSLAFLLSQHNSDAYTGVESGPLMIQLWEFIYFSAVTITTLGYGDIYPQSIISQVLVLIELGFGLFFIVFLFSTIVSLRISQVNLRDIG